MAKSKPEGNPDPASPASPRSEYRSASDTTRHHSGRQLLPPDSPARHSEWRRKSSDLPRASPRPSPTIGVPPSHLDGVDPSGVSRPTVASGFGDVRPCDGREPLADSHRQRRA